MKIEIMEPVSKSMITADRPYHLRRVCKAEWIPVHTFSEGYIRYWLALSLNNFSKSPLLNCLSINQSVISERIKFYLLPAKAIHSVCCLGFCKIFFLTKISSSIALALV